MESFKEKLNEIRRIIDEDSHRRRVLLLCQQTEPKSFDEYSSSGSFGRIEKFESSTYSEVLRAVNLTDNNRPVVMKIMRALSKGVIKRLPSMTTKGCQAYNDILNELVVTQALSQLHDGVLLNGKPNALFRTHFFCLIHEIKVVSGNLERTLSRSRMSLSSMQVNRAADQKQQPIAADGNNNNNKNSSFVPIGNNTDGNTSNNDSSNLPSTTATSATTRSDIIDTATGRKLSVTLLSQESKSDFIENPRTIESSAGAEAEQQRLQQQQDQQQLTDNEIKDEYLRGLPEDERMLMEALPHEYVVSVMRHDGQPLWWMMTHKKLTSEQLTSVLIQVIVGLAIAENVYLYEHRDLHVSNILIKKTSNEHIPFVLDGQRFNIVSHGVKATIIDATFSRLTHNNRVYFRDLTSTLRAYGAKKTPAKMSLQNRSYREMVRVTKNRWEDFTPKTNLIWLTYLCETLMKNEILRGNPKLLIEIKKIRDYTLKVNTTFDLLGYFPFEKERKPQVS